MRLNANFKQILLVIISLFISVPSHAGKHPPTEFGRQLSYDIQEILIKHNMPVHHDRADPWYKFGSGSDSWFAGNPSYTVYLFEANQITFAAKIEIIQHCIKVHESRGRIETIRIQMRTEPFKPELIRPKPYFEMTLNYMPQK